MNVFITGASSGIGEALARHYADARCSGRPLRPARGRACTRGDIACAGAGRDVRGRRARCRVARARGRGVHRAFRHAGYRDRQRRHFARHADRARRGPASFPVGVRDERARHRERVPAVHRARCGPARQRSARRHREHRRLSRLAGIGRVQRVEGRGDRLSREPARGTARQRHRGRHRMSRATSRRR